MNTFFFRSLLGIAVATSFLLSCSKVEKDQIKPTNTGNTNATARIDGVLYSQLQPANLGASFGVAREQVISDDFTVPVGETWKLEKVVYYSRVVNNLLTVRIYEDNNGKPGEILSTSINPAKELLESFQSTIGPIKVIEADIEDINLKEGTYWVGFSTDSDLEGVIIIFHQPVVGFPAAFIRTNDDIISQSFSLDFQLLASVVTETTIEDVLTTFNTSVTAGTITGTGPGKSAANRVNAFKNMLNNAKLLLAANDLAGVCTQLTDAQKRIHTGEKVRPDHFITGSQAGALKDLITELKTDLGCL